MLPKVIIHTEVSVDGRMDRMREDNFLYYRMIEGWKIDAMLAGSNTILAAYSRADSAEEESAEPPQKEPGLQRHAVVDSRGRIRCWRQIQQGPWWGEVTALCSHATPQSYLDYLKDLRIDTIVTGEEHVDLRAALEELNARYGIEVVRTDSGGLLHGALLRAGLVSEISIILNPCLVGGTTPRSFFVAPDLPSTEGIIPVKLVHVEQVEGDFVWLKYQVVSW